MPLRIRSYVSDALPPLEYVTSVRSIVFREDEVLVLRNEDSMHIMPGGRRETGETVEETLRCEVLEEAGWEISRIVVLGFRHLQHLAPKPREYLYPYPDFLWVMCMADAAEFVPAAILADDYEIEATFRPATEVRVLDVTQGERLYLDAALKRRMDAMPARPPGQGRPRAGHR